MENTRFTTKDLVLSSLLIALVFVATEFINFRLPVSINGGLVHLGNAALFFSAIIFGKNKGAIAGAFGMGLFDVLSGWMLWAPFTFVIRGVMGYIVGSIANSRNKNGANSLRNLIAVTIGGIWMLVGYYFAEVFIYGSFITPLTSIPGNLLQLVFGIVIGLPAATALKSTKLF